MLPGIALMGAMALGGTAGSFWAEISDEFVSKTASTTGGPKTLTAGPVTVIPHGGSGSPVYAWAQTSGDTMTITAPSSASTSFSASVPANGEKSGTFRCIVTDSSGATDEVSVNVTLELSSFA